MNNARAGFPEFDAIFASRTFQEVKHLFVGDYGSLHHLSIYQKISSVLT